MVSLDRRRPNEPVRGGIKKPSACPPPGHDTRKVRAGLRHRSTPWSAFATAGPVPPPPPQCGSRPPFRGGRCAEVPPPCRPAATAAATFIVWRTRCRGFGSAGPDGAPAQVKAREGIFFLAAASRASPCRPSHRPTARSPQHQRRFRAAVVAFTGGDQAWRTAVGRIHQRTSTPVQGIGAGSFTRKLGVRWAKPTPVASPTSSSQEVLTESAARLLLARQ